MSTNLESAGVSQETIAKILSAYALSNNPQFIAHSVFSDVSDENVNIVKRFLDDKDFIAFAEATKHKAELSDLQKPEQVRATYQIILQNIRDKLARDIIAKINNSNELGTWLTAKQMFVAEIKKLFELEMLVLGQPTDIKASVKFIKNLGKGDKKEIDITGMQHKLSILERNENQKQFLNSAKEEKIEEAQVVVNEQEEKEEKEQKVKKEKRQTRQGQKRVKPESRISKSHELRLPVRPAEAKEKREAIQREQTQWS